MINLLSDVADLEPLRISAEHIEIANDGMLQLRGGRYRYDPRCSMRHDRAILRHLMDAGGWVTFDELEEVIWGTRKDGGPSATRRAIAATVSHMRDRLRPGFSIESRQNWGYRLTVDETVLLAFVARTLAA